jgi:hypothetical protein
VSAALLFESFWFCVCELLQGEAGVVLELPDQKVQGFLVSIALNRLFFKHAHKVFGEIPVRL